MLLPSSKLIEKRLKAQISQGHFLSGLHLNAKRPHGATYCDSSCSRSSCSRNEGNFYSIPETLGKKTPNKQVSFLNLVVQLHFRLLALAPSTCTEGCTAQTATILPLKSCLIDRTRLLVNSLSPASAPLIEPFDITCKVEFSTERLTHTARGRIELNIHEHKVHMHILKNIPRVWAEWSCWLLREQCYLSSSRYALIKVEQCERRTRHLLSGPDNRTEKETQES